MDKKSVKLTPRRTLPTIARVLFRRALLPTANQFRTFVGSGWVQIQLKCLMNLSSVCCAQQTNLS
jgi:hypothetical protein